MDIRKIFGGIFATCLMGATLVSCSDDLTPDGPVGDGTVVFSVKLDEVSNTRAYTLDVRNVEYGIYDLSGNLMDKGSQTVTDLQATIEMKLVAGETYNIVFFAKSYAGNDPYTINWDTHTLNVNYANMNGGSGTSDYKYNNDCFYAAVNGYEAGSSIQENVTLERPVAQINFGTDDLSETAVTHKYSTVYTSLTTKAYNQFDLITGDVAGEAEVTLPYKRPLKSGVQNIGEFPVAGYEYAALLYVFVPKEQTLLDITFNTGTSRSTTTPVQSLVIPNAPVQRNYRTNIYGSLLTNSTDWKISIDKFYSGAESIWLGDVKEPQEVDGVYTITGPAELAGIAKMVNGGNSLAGKTVKLAANLNLDNRPWTPIGRKGGTGFAGTFDGGGYTISNLNLVSGDKNTGLGLFGLFGSGSNPTPEIRNLTIDGATVNSMGVNHGDANNQGTGVVVGDIFPNGLVTNVVVRNANVQAYRWAGGIAGRAYGNITNCTVENSSFTVSFEEVSSGSWDNADKVGAICGMSCEGGYTLSGNNASNVNVTGYRHAGGLFGLVNYGYENSKKTLTNNSITNSVVTQTLVHNYKNIAPGDLVGRIYGAIGTYNGQENVVNENNTESGVELIIPQQISTPQALVTALSNGGGGRVEITADMTVPASSYLMLTNDTEVDLGNSTLTIEGAGGLEVADGAKLVISGQNGVVTSSGTPLIGNPNSTIVIESGTIRSTSTTAGKNAVNTDGDFIMNGGTIENTSNNESPLVLQWPNNQEPRKAEINGGVVKAHDNYALNVRGGTNTKIPHKIVINGGSFIGPSGARFDGNVAATINGGYFIKTSSSYGHPLCTGAESFTNSDNCKVTVNGGYFYDGSNSSYSICRAGTSTIVVNSAYLNRTTGINDLLGAGHSLITLSPATTVTVDGNNYSFPYQVK